MMTQVAQAALRRVIEQYTKNVRFCIICNYVNKIAPAIQSRCTCFRFSPLPIDQVEKRLVTVVEAEKVRLTDDSKKALLKLLKGDMHRAVNVLQACHAAYDIIGDVLVDLKADDNSPVGDEDAWGFDDQKQDARADAEIEGLDSNGNGWEFDDEVEVESDEGKRENGDDGYDPGDAWGWNNEDQSSSSEDVSEEMAWGDPWGDIPTDDPAPPVPLLMSHEAAGTSAKIVNTDKAKVNGNSPTSFQNTAAPTVPHKPPEKRPPKLTLMVTYLVSG
ncbi:P-loop containing nucleoside triphosphate hydrolase protein [Armillaria mellea]|nr:P-loop containing nucleoside triphosphate hydrolase protein [Armillaria mellea]